jgi:hypothetical protein
MCSLQNFILFIFFIVVLGEGTLWYLQRFLQCSWSSILEFTTFIIFLYLLPLIPGMVSTAIIFAFTYMCTHYFQCTHPLIPFSHHLSPLTGANTLHPGKDLFCPLVLQFCRRKKVKDKKKNMTFCLFKINISTQGVSLWCFHSYVYCNPTGLSPLAL